MSLYASLRVPSNASPAEISKAYRTAALEHHPDRPNVEGSDAFLSLQAAYETLKSLEKRKEYDHLQMPWEATRNLACRVRSETNEDVVLVSWSRLDYAPSGYALRVREASGDWKLVYMGSKRKVAVRSLAPGRFFFSCFALGGPSAEIAEVVVPDRVQQLVMRGMSENRARSALARNGNCVDAALEELLSKGKKKEKRKKRKKKKKPSISETVEMPPEDIIKCSRCKIVVALEEVAEHQCDEGKLIMMRITALERAHGVT